MTALSVQSEFDFERERTLGEAEIPEGSGPFNPEQAAQKLGCVAEQVFRLVEAGKLTPYNISAGKSRMHMRFTRSELLRYINDNRIF